MQLRALAPADIAWAETLVGGFGGRMQARRGELIDVLDAPGFIAIDEDGNALGVLTYARRPDGVELLYIEAATRQRGIGSALLDALFEVVGHQTVWLVTTNDNVDALRFYQRRGFVIRAVRVGAVNEARTMLKPQLPLVGAYGIPLRDEIELATVRS